ncbi:MAG TPA: ABC transporter substrate-binding protein [Acetobacteraceae bacterium]|jgi:multiple sugar transport system substrate-binding protein|nr:ABC transporter substrate-binding protein [Acetobacteraceae bacterium]
MGNLSRREAIRASLGVVAGAALARPFIANAAAKTATVWWVQGFAQEEDVSFRKVVAEYEKASGNTMDYSIIPYAPARQKIVSAITSGEVPDLFTATPAEIVALYAWQGKLVDVADVVETQRSQYSETALLSAQCYNSITKRRGFYGVPYTGAVLPNHIWKPLVEKAGYKMEDIPKTWDAYYDFFKGVQKKLRAQGMRNVYGLGFQITANGVDPNSLYNYFLIANGGQDIVTNDGRLHLDEPKVKAAVIKALTYPATAYKEGFVPPGAVNWNDADDNNAFHAKQVVMDLDGTISTEVAIIKDRQDYDDIVTMGLPLSNEGTPVPSLLTPVNALIPEGAKNIDVAKDFLKYFIQPQVNNDWLKVGLGRNIPVMPATVRNDPWWFADPHRAAYTQQGVLGLTVPAYWAFNPAYAQVQSEHVWSTAWFDILNAGMSPEAAADKAFKRITEIFSKYPILQS